MFVLPPKELPHVLTGLPPLRHLVFSSVAAARLSSSPWVPKVPERAKVPKVAKVTKVPKVPKVPEVPKLQRSQQFLPKSPVSIPEGG